MKKAVAIAMTLALLISVACVAIPMSASAGSVNTKTGTVLNSCDIELKDTLIPTVGYVPGQTFPYGSGDPGAYAQITENMIEGTGCYQVSRTENDGAYTRLHIPYEKASTAVDEYGRMKLFLRDTATGNAYDYGVQMWIYAEDFAPLLADANAYVIIASDGYPGVGAHAFGTTNAFWQLKGGKQSYALENGKWNLVVFPYALLDNPGTSFDANQLMGLTFMYSANIPVMIDDIRIVKLADVGVDATAGDADKFVLTTKKFGQAADVPAELNLETALDASALKYRDAALFTWVYAEGWDAMAAVDDGLTLTVASDGAAATKIMSWNLSKYPLEEGKWNLVALPFKEANVSAEMDFAAINYLKVSISEMPEGAVLDVKEPSVVNFTKYLQDNAGIAFFDGYEKRSLPLDLSADGVYGSSVNLIQTAPPEALACIANYSAGIDFVTFNQADPLDLSYVEDINNLDVYFSFKMNMNYEDLSGNVILGLTSDNGAYSMDKSMKFVLYNDDMWDIADGEWHRVSSSADADGKVSWLLEAYGMDLANIANARFLVDVADANTSVLIDNLMLVDSSKYNGVENVYIVKTTDKDGSNVVEKFSVKQAEEDEESSTPDEESSTPNEESSTPDEESSTPDVESSTPDEEVSTPDEEASTPNEEENPDTGVGVVVPAFVLAAAAGAALVVLKRKQ